MGGKSVQGPHVLAKIRFDNRQADAGSMIRRVYGEGGF